MGPRHITERMACVSSHMQRPKPLSTCISGGVHISVSTFLTALFFGTTCLLPALFSWDLGKMTGAGGAAVGDDVHPLRDRGHAGGAEAGRGGGTTEGRGGTARQHRYDLILIYRPLCSLLLVPGGFRREKTWQLGMSALLARRKQPGHGLIFVFYVWVVQASVRWRT